MRHRRLAVAPSLLIEFFHFFSSSTAVTKVLRMHSRMLLYFEHAVT